MYLLLTNILALSVYTQKVELHFWTTH